MYVMHRTFIARALRHACAAFLLTATSAPSRAAQLSGPSVGFPLQNSSISAIFGFAPGGHLHSISVTDIRSRAQLHPSELFEIIFQDGRTVPASQFSITTGLHNGVITPVTTASRAAERIAAKTLCAGLLSPDHSLAVDWCAILRDGTNYMRQEVTLSAPGKGVAVNIAEVRLFDYASSQAKVVGAVPGSPIVDGNFFLGFESPLSVSTAENGRAIALLKRTLPLEAGQSITYSSVIGVTAPGQLRRDFLSYLELERAHPYRTFLHYNNWYDTGNQSDEISALDRVHAFGEELVRKRRVTMNSFLFDDGWDDTHSIWQFNSRFPDKFTTIRAAAATYGFNIGVWLSPWGGYGQDKKDRIAAGEKAGFETVKGGFALSGPKYYARFQQVCLDMISNYGVNQFKFDGTGNVSSVFPGSLFDSDFSAAIHLIERLRQQQPDIFINLTTGTWPSPFWVRTADSIWRGGDDHNFSGVGIDRQKWITYRDQQLYKNIVLGGPLYPINSLMLHGVIYGDRAHNLTTDPGNAFTDEVHDYFGEGTQLQELYITPARLTSANWDALAESAKWSRANADVLVDTHWIGGNPLQLQVYGFASWTPRKGILVLRNPLDKPQTISIDVAKTFELPTGAPGAYRAHSPWAADKSAADSILLAGHTHTFTLQPFEVITLEALPVK